MSSFNVASPSAAALTTGDAMAIIMSATELQALSYSELQTMQQQEGKASIATGEATKAATLAQAASTREQGMGSIFSGGLQVAGEAGSTAYSGLIGSRMETKDGFMGLTGKTVDTDLGRYTKELENVKSWETALSRPDAKLGVSRQNGVLNDPSQDEISAAKKRLSVNLVKTSITDSGETQEEAAKRGDGTPRTYKDDVETLLTQSEKDPEISAKLDDLRERVYKEKDSIQKKIDSIQDGHSRTAARISSFGQMAGQIAQGVKTIGAAEQTADQANEQLIQVAAEFLKKSMEQAITAENQNVSNMGSARDATVSTLLRGTAEANVYRG